MKYLGILIACLFLSSQVMADTLFQGNVGGYSTGVGVGLGGGLTTGYSPYSSPNTASSYTGYPSGVSPTGVPYDNFTYPYSSGCCGCNSCNNCDTSYSNRCR